MSGQDYEQLTLFQGDSHASRLVLPGSEGARKMTVISGRKCLELNPHLKEAIKVALSTLTPPNDPLTEEQLKKKIGDPVFIESKCRAEWMLLWGYHPPEVYGRAFVFTRRTAQKELFPFSELGVTWNAYAYPPAHIDLEEWEPCSKCRSCASCLSSIESVKYYPCLQCERYENFSPRNFCPECGRPLTPEARAMLEKRLRGFIE